MDRIRDFLLSKSLSAVEIILLGILLLFGYTRDIASVEFHPDESFWIVSSVRLDKLLAGDFESALWTDEPVIIFEVRPLPSYFTAVGQRVGGLYAQDLPPYWIWGLPDEENLARGAMPSDELIWWSRLPMVVIAAFSMLLTAVLLAKSHSRLAAYIFVFISLNGYFLLNLRRAMSEASILFFTVLTMYASYKLLIAVISKDMNKSILWSLVVGLFSGLAGQSKLTGLICAGIAILGVILVIIPRPAQWPSILKQRMLLTIIFVISMTTLVTFIASYPFFYMDTVDRISETLYARNQILEYQVYTYADELIPSNSRLTILFQRILDYPLHLDANQVLNIPLHWLNFTFVALGMAQVIKQVRNSGTERDINLVLLLGALLCAVPMLFAPFDWERYYLYPIYFGCIFFAIGAGQLAERFSRSVNTQKTA
jgi:hypothetical protein